MSELQRLLRCCDFVKIIISYLSFELSTSSFFVLLLLFTIYFCRKSDHPISLHADYKEHLRMDQLKCYGKHKNKSSKQLLKYFVYRTIFFIGFISVLVEAVFNLLQMLKSCSRKRICTLKNSEPGHQLFK